MTKNDSTRFGTAATQAAATLHHRYARAGGHRHGPYRVLQSGAAAGRLHLVSHCKDCAHCIEIVEWGRDDTQVLNPAFACRDH